MYRKILPPLVMVLGLTSWAGTGLAASIQRAARPVIASTTVDTANNILIVSGRHFGDGTVIITLGDRVLRVKSHSDREVVAEIPEGLAPGSYRLTVTSAGPSKQSSEPFSAAVFAAR